MHVGLLEGEGPQAITVHFGVCTGSDSRTEAHEAHEAGEAPGFTVKDKAILSAYLLIFLSSYFLIWQRGGRPAEQLGSKQD